MPHPTTANKIDDRCRPQHLCEESLGNRQAALEALRLTPGERPASWVAVRDYPKAYGNNPNARVVVLEAANDPDLHHWVTYEVAGNDYVPVFVPPPEPRYVAADGITPRQPTPFEQIAYLREVIILKAAFYGWGSFVRSQMNELLGEVEMVFEHGSDTYRLPAGSHYPGETANDRRVRAEQSALTIHPSDRY